MYELIRDIDSFDQTTINPSFAVFCDTETCEEEGLTVTGKGLYGRIRLFQVYQAGWDKAILFDCFFVPLSKVLSLLKPCHLVFHNAAYDLHTVNLKTQEVWKPSKLSDTLYLSRLHFYTKTKFGFYECLEYAGHADELIKGIDKKEEQKSNWSGPLSINQKTYAACDVVYLEKLYEVVKQHENHTVYSLDIKSLELALQYARNGMPINRKTVSKLQKKYMDKLESTLDELPVNPRSSLQCRKYLETKSSSADVLISLVQQGNSKAKKIQTARHCYKSLEYLKAYDRDNIKGFFQPCAALSGRFSCSGGNRHDHANLQQMPEELHSVVEADEDNVVIYNDYSGLELRMAAAYTGEPTMCRMMIDGSDMHTETAKFIFNTQTPTDEERTVAKTFNFSLIYGSGVKTVKDMLKTDAGVEMTFQEVKERIENWFDFYSYYREWHTIHKKQLNIYGYVDIETALGRKVRTYKLTDSLNFPIQGSSVEVTKTSIGLLYSRYPKARLVNTIHDSNILIQKEVEAEKWKQRLSECMVDAWEYVIQDLAEPLIPMPHGGDIGKIWTFH